MTRIPPKIMAGILIEILQKELPDPDYLKNVFRYVREALELEGGTIRSRQLPEILTEAELVKFYNAVWKASSRNHMIMLKLILFTGIRNSELANIMVKDVDLDQLKIRIKQEKGKKERYVLFPLYFREELAQYISIQWGKNAVFLFESNRHNKFTTRWIREIVKNYAKKAGILKRINPHLFRHQILAYLTSKGIVDAKIQFISGHKNKDSLSIYRNLSLSDINKEYWDAMKDFPIQ